MGVFLFFNIAQQLRQVKPFLISTIRHSTADEIKRTSNSCLSANNFLDELHSG